ncbi:solute carrier family 22 member 13-like isoform X4 [Ascaphus truei]|uniref:solute carrier family 22 member 13-like isoform X4 n=1 Tax=Ascaphus truei TaxID=8439 RepID=UPI003F59FC4A
MTDFGEILKNVGEFGRFQKILVLLISSLSFLNAFHMFAQIFMGISVSHHCDTSWILDVSPNLTKEQQLNYTIPQNVHGAYEQCLMYTPVDWDIESIEKHGLNASEKCQNGWVYDTSEQKSTLVTEFDLVCNRKEYIDISLSLYMMGLLIGSLIFGPLGDRIGRRPVILISMLLQLSFGVGLAFVTNFFVYIALRCVVGIAMSGILINNLVLVAEWVGSSQRARATITGHVCFAVGLMVLAGLSYAIRNWRLLQLVGSLPTALLFFYIWVLPESPRWLLTKGKNEKAKKLLQKAATINKRTIPEEILSQVCQQSCILWPKPECRELRFGHISHSAYLWSSGNSSSCWIHLYGADNWKKAKSIILSITGWSRVSSYHCDPKRTSCCNHSTCSHWKVLNRVFIFRLLHICGGIVPYCN